MKKTQALILTATVIILVIFALIFYKKFFITAPEQAPAKPELKKITMMVPSISQIEWAAYYTAKSKGYYEDEGLDVEIQYSTKGAAGPIEQLAGGNVDFIVTTEDGVIMARARDLDIVAVYPIGPANTFYIISEKNKNITKPADLIGKKIAVISSGSGTYTNLQAILHKSGINQNKVDIIQTGISIAPAFLEKKFDAASVHLSQKLLIEEKMPDLNVINASDYTNLSGIHIAVMGNLVKINPQIIKKFLTATKKGLRYAVNNPEEAVNIYINYYPDAESKRKISQDLWRAFIKEFHYQTNLPGPESPENWQTSQDVLYETGLITKKTNISEMYTNEFIPK